MVKLAPHIVQRDMGAVARSARSPTPLPCSAMTVAEITRLHRQWTEWAERPQNRRFLEQDQEAQLRTSLPMRERQPQAQVAAWMLGSWHLGCGLLRAFDGDGEGFDQARIGQALRRSSLLLRARGQGGTPGRRGGTRAPFSRAHGAWTALLGLALHDPGAEPLYDLLRHEPESSFRDGEDLALFVRELLTARAGERPTVTPRLGPYQDAFALWNGDSRLYGQRLAELLDLHLDGVAPAGAPFDDMACKLYPVEILALRAVREGLGLALPKVDHPLMHTNLVMMAMPKAWPRHELVRQLETELRRR
jgi:hypothetical protein